MCRWTDLTPAKNRWSTLQGPFNAAHTAPFPSIRIRQPMATPACYANRLTNSARYWSRLPPRPRQYRVRWQNKEAQGAFILQKGNESSCTGNRNHKRSGSRHSPREVCAALFAGRRLARRWQGFETVIQLLQRWGAVSMPMAFESQSPETDTPPPSPSPPAGTVGTSQTAFGRSVLNFDHIEHHLGHILCSRYEDRKTHPSRHPPSEVCAAIVSLIGVRADTPARRVRIAAKWGFGRNLKHLGFLLPTRFRIDVVEQFKNRCPPFGPHIHRNPGQGPVFGRQDRIIIS